MESDVLFETKYPKTVEEAVDRLLKILTPEEIADLKSKAEDELWKYHHSLGKYIRNKFGLWDDNQDLMKSIENEYFIIIDKVYATDVSCYIVRKLWSILKDRENG